MPWEKQFDRDVVLDKAMLAFWQQGYDGTSMKDLINCTGLNPGSIYATFGDKKNLFCLALERYESLNRIVLADYENRLSPREAILEVFHRMISDVRNDPARGACFLINSVIEIAPKDDKIARAAEAALTAFEGYFRRMITAGQQQGDINPAVDSRKTARILLGLVVGGRVLGRSHLDDAALSDYLEQADRLLS